MADATRTEKVEQPAIATVASNNNTDVKIVKLSAEKGADALLAYAHQAASVALDEATNKRLLRKIDTRILPWLCCLYILQYLDKGV